jgi:hypothetical protein
MQERASWVRIPCHCARCCALVFCSRLDGDKLTSQEKEMSILKSTGFVAGHYECRSLAETLPVFTDLLAMEVVERTASVATLKHPNTEWRLIVHEGGLQRSPRNTWRRLIASPCNSARQRKSNKRTASLCRIRTHWA